MFLSFYKYNNVSLIPLLAGSNRCGKTSTIRSIDTFRYCYHGLTGTVDYKFDSSDLLDLSCDVEVNDKDRYRDEIFLLETVRRRKDLMSLKTEKLRKSARYFTISVIIVSFIFIFGAIALLFVTR